MKAVVVREFTSFKNAEIGELPDPAPAAGEVVVDLEASEANYPDILYIEGRYQKLPPLPFSPGLAGGGRVSAVGAGIDATLLGQQVLVLPEYGTHAEKVAAPADFCFPVPDDMACDVAASFGLVYQTAYFGLAERAQFAAGESVLVLGATGGIGMAALQLSKALGASTVIAATRGPEGAALAREMGADVVVDSAMEDLRDGLRAAVYAATDGRGADVVIDPVGGALAAAALRAMAWCGRFVVVGFASGDIPKFPANYLLVKNIAVTGLQWTDYRARRLDLVREAQERIFRFWREGRLKPLITMRCPLEQCAKGFGALSAGSASGKIILTMGDG